MKALFGFLNGDEAAQIHEASLAVLEKTGIKVESEKVRRLLARHGAREEGSKVRLPREMATEAIKQVRRQFVLTARDPAWHLTVPSGSTLNATRATRHLSMTWRQTRSGAPRGKTCVTLPWWLTTWMRWPFSGPSLCPQTGLLRWRSFPPSIYRCGIPGNISSAPALRRRQPGGKFALPRR